MGLFSPLGRLTNGLQNIDEWGLLIIGDDFKLSGLKLDDLTDKTGEYCGNSVVNFGGGAWDNFESGKIVSSGGRAWFDWNGLCGDWRLWYREMSMKITKLRRKFD